MVRNQSPYSHISVRMHTLAQRNPHSVLKIGTFLLGVSSPFAAASSVWCGGFDREAIVALKRCSDI